MLIVPLVLVAAMLVVQVGLAYHARQVLAGATDDGANTGARLGASPADGASLAGRLIDSASGPLLESTEVTASSDGDIVTVTATARVAALLPFFDSITVSATSTARVEQFEPQEPGP